MTKFYPSFAHIWAPENGCMGFPKLLGECKRPLESQAMRDGIEKHAIAEKSMLSSATTEHHDVNIYLEKCRSLPGKHYVEQKLTRGKISGRIDFFSYDDDTETIYIVDFKTGKVPVESEYNWQLITYAYLIEDFLEYMHGAVRLELMIVQPNVYTGVSIDSWCVTYAELQDSFRILERSMELAVDDNVEVTTGNHCKNCPLALQCDAALEAGVRLYEVSKQVSSGNNEPVNVGLKLDFVQRASEQINTLKKALEAEAEELIKQGKAVHGYILASEKGRREWVIKGGKLQELASLYNVQLTKEVPITPTQALGLGVPKEIIDNETISKRKESLKLRRFKFNMQDYN